SRLALSLLPSAVSARRKIGQSRQPHPHRTQPATQTIPSMTPLARQRTKPRTAVPTKPDFLSTGQGGRVGVRLVGAIWRDVTDRGRLKRDDYSVQSEGMHLSGMIRKRAIDRDCRHSASRLALSLLPSAVSARRKIGQSRQPHPHRTQPATQTIPSMTPLARQRTKPRTAVPTKPDFLSTGQGGRVGVRLVGTIWRDVTDRGGLTRAVYAALPNCMHLSGMIRKRAIDRDCRHSASRLALSLL